MSQCKYILTVLAKSHLRKNLNCLTISRPNSGLDNTYYECSGVTEDAEV